MKRFLFLFLFGHLLFTLRAQTADEVLLLQKFNKEDLSKSQKEIPEIKKNDSFNPISGLFRFYKNFISSQDAVSCTFTPSCSEYALEALQKEGFFIGFLNAFDRLERCNGLNKTYPFDINKGKLYDPLRNFYYQSANYTKCPR